MSTKSPLRAADELFSRSVRALALGCFAQGFMGWGTVTGCSPYLQACHIHSRRYKAIRWDLHNAVAMCSAHHVWFTHHPLEWQDFIEQKLPGRWDEMKRKALFDPPEKPKDALERLKRQAA